MARENNDGDSFDGWGEMGSLRCQWVRMRGLAQRCVLPLTLLAILAAFQFRLGSVVINDMDEGTYLYQGRLIAEGFVPYRDFFVAHPPLVPLFGAATYWLFGDSLALARAAYSVIVLLLACPIYAVVRHHTQSAVAAVLAIVAYSVGLLAIANMGRTVRLEPVVGGLLVSAFSLALLRRDSGPWRVVVGALMALAVLTKLTAVVPVALFALFEAFEARSNPRALVVPWSVQFFGAVLVLAPALAYLVPLEGFVQDVWTLQATRPVIPFEGRLYLFQTNLLRYPPLAASLIAGVYYLLRPGTREVRAFAWLVVSGTFVLVFLMPVYLSYYVAQLMPYVAIVFAVAAWSTFRIWIPGWSNHALAAAAAAAGAAMLVYAEVYYRTADGHVSSAARAAAIVEASSGSVYSMFPGYAVVTRRPLTPWHYMTDSLLPRITNHIGEEELMEVFARSDVLVLFPEEIDGWSRARELVERDFRLEYRDQYWVVWTRR